MDFVVRKMCIVKCIHFAWQNNELKRFKVYQFSNNVSNRNRYENDNTVYVDLLIIKMCAIYFCATRNLKLPLYDWQIGVHVHSNCPH